MDYGFSTRDRRMRKQNAYHKMIRIDLSMNFILKITLYNFYFCNLGILERQHQGAGENK